MVALRKFQTLIDLVGKTEYAPTIKVFANNNGSDTNHMDLNSESAKALIEWLKINFVSKKKHTYKK